MCEKDLNMKHKITLFVFYLFISVTSILSHDIQNQGSLNSYKLVVHSGIINLQVKNDGFHRLLQTTITADYEMSNRKDCVVTIQYKFPADIYVDKFELATNNPNQKIEFYVDNKFIDVEIPAYKSDPFILYVVNYTLPDSINKLTEVEFPIHLRYQKATEDMFYKEVLFGNVYSDVQMFYLCKGSINSNWQNFLPNSNEWIPANNIKVNKHVIMYVPVGNTNQFLYVFFITHSVVLLGTFYILRHLIITPSSNIAVMKHSSNKY